MSVPSAPPGSAMQALFEALHRAGSTYAGAVGAGGAWTCPNPEHDDERASFDVKVGDSVAVVGTCTPCRDAMGQDEFRRVLAEQGITFNGGVRCEPTEVDWGPKAESTPTGKGARPNMTRLTAVYTYNWEDGRPNFEVKRYETEPDAEKRAKRFAPVRWDEQLHRYVGGVGALDDVVRTPYNLERFAEWKAAGLPLYLVEGEKAADALTEAGKAATTFHGGTAGKLEPTWYEWFRGFKVRVWPDADEAGVRRARDLAFALDQELVAVELWGDTESAPKDDAYDTLAAHRKPHHLSTDELNDLMRLHPMPKRPESPSTAPATVSVGGKTLVSAERLSEAYSEPPPGSTADTPDSRKPFPALRQDPEGLVAQLVAEKWTRKGVPMIRFDGGLWWRYKPSVGHYTEVKPYVLRSKVSQALRGRSEAFVASDGTVKVRPIRLTNAAVTEVVGALERYEIVFSDVEWGVNVLPAHGGVPFRNGWLDVASGEFTAADPRRFTRWAVPVDYDAALKGDPSETPAWHAFLTSIGWGEGTEEYRLLRQWYGYALSGSIKHHKALGLFGPKRSGKGTIMHVCAELVGDGHTGTQLASLDKRESLALLADKTLATLDDVRFDRLPAAVRSNLLSITGGGALEVKRLYRDPENAIIPARLMFGTNEYPNFNESSDALASRLILMTMTETFYEREDFDLQAKLDAELAGIAAWSLVGLRDLNQVGRFSETAAGRAAVAQIAAEGSQVRQFAEECLEFLPTFSDGTEEVFDSYVSWATRSNLRYTLDKRRFQRELRDAFPEIGETQPRKLRGKTVRVWTGLRRLA